MTNRQSIDWRRWAAMLCIALVAVVYAEPVHADDHAAPAAADMIHVGDGHVVIHTHDDIQGDHHRDGGEPQHDGTEPHAHHCAAAHAAQLPASEGAIGIEQSALSMGFAFDTPWLASGPVYGLERPPRFAA